MDEGELVRLMAGRAIERGSAELAAPGAEELLRVDPQFGKILEEPIPLEETLEDIRQVQLARAAMRAGVEILLSESGWANLVLNEVGPLDFAVLLYSGVASVRKNKESTSPLIGPAFRMMVDFGSFGV